MVYIVLPPQYFHLTRKERPMLIQVGYDIIFEHPAPTPIIAMLYLHPSHRLDIRRGDFLLVEPPSLVGEYIDVFGNRCARLLAPAGQLRFWNDAVVEDSGQPDYQIPEPNSMNSLICRMRRSLS